MERSHALSTPKNAIALSTPKHAIALPLSVGLYPYCCLVLSRRMN
ncbi:hypothetical protein [Coleofasciculus sp. E1-EBD-02]